MTDTIHLSKLNFGELTVQREVGSGSTNPRQLITNYVQRADQVRQGQHVVSTLVVKIKNRHAVEACVVIDKILQQYLRGNDLVLRVNERVWLLLARCPLKEVDALITRLERAWDREKRSDPQERLPALCFEYCSTRLLDGDAAVIGAELIDQYQRLKETSSAKSS